ncbi:hypothetical protein CPB83DRAFT_571931 [Crepidotus variabilis]|uniref:BTB domain-containing protein n=1 Tax=Crepidotus variabilis TaxID=179855 RepID=A0A9P6JL72_9AGAR|nr:hypothetical protein CPB83DRAFT_571931 [Crepidotus variabilis]
MTSPQELSPSNGRHAHPEYYLVGGDLYFLFDITILRVHSYFFRRDSEKFAELLEAPIKTGEFKVGTKENPLELKDVTLDEFESFLWVFYNRKYSDYSEGTAENYVAILKISEEYGFPNVKAFAIDALEARSDIMLSQRIALYRHYRVGKKYILPLFLQAIMREEVDWISDEEIEEVGPQAFNYLLRARERLLRITKGGTSDWTEKNAKKALSSTPGKDTLFNTSEFIPSPIEDTEHKTPPYPRVLGLFAPPGPSN